MSARRRGSRFAKVRLLILALLVFQGSPAYEARQVPERARALLSHDDPAWADTREVVWGPEPCRTRFRALWSEAGLHLRYESEDDEPWFTLTERDDPLWEGEVVEIFRDPLGDGRYVED